MDDSGTKSSWGLGDIGSSPTITHCRLPTRVHLSAQILSRSNLFFDRPTEEIPQCQPMYPHTRINIHTHMRTTYTPQINKYINKFQVLILPQTCPSLAIGLIYDQPQHPSSAVESVSSFLSLVSPSHPLTAKFSFLSIPKISTFLWCLLLIKS